MPIDLLAELSNRQGAAGSTGGDGGGGGPVDLLSTKAQTGGPVDLIAEYEKRQKVNVDPSNGLEEKGLFDAFTGGVTQTTRALGGTVDVLTDDKAGLVDLANRETPQTEAQIRFGEAIQRNEEDDPDDLGFGAGLWEAVKNVGGAIAEEPRGAMHEMVAQVPNSAVVLGGMAAGAKAGAVLFAPVAPIGAFAGGLVGGVAGMFAGNFGVEAGNLGMSRAKEEGEEVDTDEVARQAAIKSGVITVLDRATLGFNKWLMGNPGKVATKTVADYMDKLGLTPEMVARSPDTMRVLREKAADAFIEAMPKGQQKTARVLLAGALETTGEGTGEYLGSKAAGLDASLTEAVLESAMSLPQSAAEVGISAYMGRGNRDLNQFMGTMPDPGDRTDPRAGPADPNTFVGPIAPAPDEGRRNLEFGVGNYDVEEIPDAQGQDVSQTPLQQLASRLKNRVEGMSGLNPSGIQLDEQPVEEVGLAGGVFDLDTAPEVELPTASADNPIFQYTEEDASELRKIAGLRKQILDNYDAMSQEEQQRADAQLAELDVLEERTKVFAQAEGEAAAQQAREVDTLSRDAMVEREMPGLQTVAATARKKLPEARRRLAELQQEVERRKVEKPTTEGIEVEEVVSPAPQNTAMADALVQAGLAPQQADVGTTTAEQPTEVDAQAKQATSPAAPGGEPQAGEVEQTTGTQLETLLNDRMTRGDNAAALKAKVESWQRKGEVDPGDPGYAQLQTFLSDKKGARVAKEEVLQFVRGTRAQGDTQAQTADETADRLNFSPRQADAQAQDIQPPEGKAPIFYSELERQLEGVSQKQAPAAQWKGTLKGLTQKGVKQEELDWVDVDGWLDEQKGPVTKDDLLNYVKSQQVTITEARKGGVNEDLEDGLRNAWAEQQASRYDKEWDDDEGAYLAYDENGEILREQYGDPRTFSEDESLVDYWRDYADGMEDYEIREQLDLQEDPTKYGSYMPVPGGENYRELLLKLPSQGEAYQSSHWDEQNVLAHVRFDERTNDAGERVLMIQEIQSDWHQSGRKRGYKGDVPTDEQVRRFFDLNDDANPADYRGEMMAHRDFQRAVPNAPFKETMTKSGGGWAGLAFKRMIRYASDNGFDRIAWATGEQSANTYDLRKQVGYIDYSPTGPNDYYIRVVGKDGGNIDTRYKQTPEQLEEFIGKELTEKIVARQGVEGDRDADGTRNYTLEGDDLAIGGEGMIGFYDQILPRNISKFVKKWGAKVEGTTLAGTLAKEDKNFLFDRSPDGRFAIIGAGQDNFGELIEYQPTEEAARARLDELNGTGEVEVWSIPITEQMRAAAQGGMPLFSPRQNAGQEPTNWSTWEPTLTSTGKILGAPKWVNDAPSPKRAMQKLYRILRNRIAEGEVGRYWYEESAKEVMRIVGNNVVDAEKFTQLLAIYSPQANVQVNTYFAVKAWNQYKNGLSKADWLSALSEEKHPNRVKTAKQDEKAVAVLYDNVPFDGRKTNSFYLNLMHEVLASAPDAVNELQLDRDLINEINKPATIDMWMYRAYGYENESAGDDQGSGAYSFSENVLRRITDRLNKDIPEGADPWLPHQVQAVIWSAMKARYEIQEVKDKTWKESIAKGYAFIGEDGKPHVPTEAAKMREHRKIWRKHAMAVTSKEATRAAQDTSASFKDFLDQMIEVVTWEAMPSPSLSEDVLGADAATKQLFSRQAASLLLSDDGIDTLAQKLGVPLAWVNDGHGGYQGDVNPNNLSHLLPTKDGAFDRERVSLYAQAIQYIFKQDAVPWFRPDARALLPQSAQTEQRFRVIDNATGRTVSTHETQAEAQAALDAKQARTDAEVTRLERLIAKREGQLESKEGDARANLEAVLEKNRIALDKAIESDLSLKGGKYAKGVALRFDAPVTDETRTAVLYLLSGALGPDSGFTQTAPNEISVINFRDDETGIPFVEDEVWSQAIDAIEDSLQSLGVSKIGDFWSEGEYGYVHDWQADPAGETVLAGGTLSRRPDLHPWLRDRRAAFEGLLEQYRGDQLRARSAEASALYGDAGLRFTPRSGSDVRGNRGGGTPGYGTGQAGSVSVSATHYSREARETLDSSLYGTGKPGAERQRLSRPSADPAVRNRIYFYVDEGQGVSREAGVGGQAHAVQLESLYDWSVDERGFWPEARTAYPGNTDDQANYVESAVNRAGFDGYYAPGAFGNQGVAVLLGDHVVDVAQGEGQPNAAPAREQTPAERLQETIDGLGLPGGNLTGARWLDAIAGTELDTPPHRAILEEQGDTRIYRSDLGRMLSENQQPAYSPRQAEDNQEPTATFGLIDDQQAQDRLRALERALGVEEGALDTGTLPDALDAGVLDSLGRILSREIIPLVNRSERKFNGVVNPATPDTIFVDIEGDAPALATIGHEFIHTLAKEFPDLFDKLAMDILRAAGVTEGDIREYSDWVNSRNPMGAELSRLKVLEEMIADISGDQFNRREFWESLQSKSPNTFAEIAQRLMAFLGRLLSGLRSDQRLKGAQYVRDIEAVQEVLAEFMAKDEAGLYSGYESETSQVRERRRAAKRRTEDLDAPASVPEAAAQNRDNFLLGYKSVPIGKVRSGVDQVTTPEEAAHVLAPFRKYGQEHMAVLVLDGQGKPTQIIQHTVGGVAESQVFPGTLAGAIAADPNASSVWIAHNHPSGNPRPSSADLRITKVITETLDGSGIAVNGHIVLAANNGEAYHLDQYGGEQGPVKVKPLVRKRTVPITERKIRKNPPKERRAVTSPDTARAMVEEMTSENAIVLLDNQHTLVGSLAMTLDEMVALRQGGQARRILSAIDKTNAAAAIIKASGPGLPNNVARFLNTGKKVRVLDAFIKGSDGQYTNSSDRGLGIEGETGPFFSPRQTEGTPDEAPAFDAPDDVSWLDKVRIKLYEKFQTLQNVQDAIGPVAERLDAMLGITLYPGRVRARLDDFEKAHIEPLKDLIGQSNLSFAEIGEYLHARHAREANRVLRQRNPDRPNNDRLSGMSDAEADEILGRHSGNYTLQRVVARIDAINAERMQMLVEEELLTPEEAASWKTNYRYYVPLHREESGTVLPKRGAGFNVRGKESRLRAGSADRPVDHENMVARILTQYEFAVQRAEKNRVAQTLYNLAKENPNDNFWIVDQVPNNPFLKTDNTIGWVGDYMNQNVMAAKFGGETRYLTFNDQNDHANQIVRALKNVDSSSSKILTPLLVINRGLAALNTSLSPEFVISNFFRDWQTAGYNLTDTELKDMKAAVLRQVPTAVRGIRNNLRGDGEHEWASWFDRFREAGGMTGWMQAYDEIGGRLKALQWDMKTEKTPGIAQFKKMFRAIEDYNNVIENGVRLSAFRTAVEAGLSEAQAARLAKELTVNFNRRGEWGVAMNAMYLFYNASIQGSVRLLRAVTDRNNKGLHKMLAGTVGFAITIELMNLLTDEDDEYKNIPSNVKDRNLVLMDPFELTEDGYFKIPLPWGYNVFHILGQEIAQAIGHTMGKVPSYSPFDSASRIGMNLLQAFNPVQDGSILQTISPTILDPATRIAENKDWHGGRLYPNYNEKQADYLKHFSNVRDTSKDLAKWLHEATLDPETLTATIDVSPEWIDMMVDFGTGSVGRILSDSFGLIKASVSGDEMPELKRYPMVRKVYATIGDSDRQRLFYEKFHEMLTVQQRLGDAPTPVAKAELIRNLGKRRQLLGPTKLTNSALTRLNKALKAAKKAGNKDAEKRIKEQRMTLMQRYMTQYYRIMYNDKG